MPEYNGAPWSTRGDLANNPTGAGAGGLTTQTGAPSHVPTPVGPASTAEFLDHILFPVTTVEPDETFAAQDVLGGRYAPWYESDEDDDLDYDYQYALVTTLDTSYIGLGAPAEPAETFAAQPHFGDIEIAAEDTTDYANDATLDVTGYLLACSGGWGCAWDSDWGNEIVADINSQHPYLQPDPAEEWFDQPLDDVTALFLSAPSEPIETFAAQPHFGDIELPADLTEDYTADTTLDTSYLNDGPLAGGTEAAAQPHFGELPIPPEETEDYANDTAVDALPAFAPPEAVVPVLLAAQPHHGDIQIDGDETGEHPAHSAETVNDITPAFLGCGFDTGFDPGFCGGTAFPDVWIAAQPMADAECDPEPDWFDQIAADDYLQLGVAAEPVETHAAQLFMDDWREEELTTDYAMAPEQNEAFAPPEIVGAELFGTQPHYGDLPMWEADAITTEADTDPSADISAYIATVFQEAIEVFAAQPHFGDIEIAADLTEDYTADTTLDTSYLNDGPAADDTFQAAQSGLSDADYTVDDHIDSVGDDLAWYAGIVQPEPVETFAAQPSFVDADPEPDWFDQVTDDMAAVIAWNDPIVIANAQTLVDFYEWEQEVAPDSPLDEGWIAAALAAPLEAFIAQPHFGEWQIEPETTDDYANDSTLDITPFFFLPTVFDLASVWFALPPSLKWAAGAPSTKWDAAQADTKWDAGSPGTKWRALQATAKWDG